MDLIKLLDVSSPKNTKSTINLLIEHYNKVDSDVTQSLNAFEEIANNALNNSENAIANANSAVQTAESAVTQSNNAINIANQSIETITNISKDIEDTLDTIVQENEIISRETLPIPTADTPDFVQDTDGLKYKKKDGDSYSYESVGGNDGNYAELDKENIFSKTQTFTSETGDPYYDGIIINCKQNGGGYVGNAIKFTHYNSNNNIDNTINISMTGNSIKLMGNSSFNNNSFYILDTCYVNDRNGSEQLSPLGTNVNLGNTTNKWRDLYLSGKITDGSYETTVADIATKTYIDNNIITLINQTKGSSIDISVDPSTYVLTINLKNSLGEVLSTSNVDLPLESMVVNGTYDNETKEVVLTLQNGNEVRFSVADLISGLVSQTDFDSFVANTPQLNKTNTFTQTQTFTAKIGSTYQDGIIINREGDSGSIPALIRFKQNSINVAMIDIAESGNPRITGNFEFCNANNKSIFNIGTNNLYPASSDISLGMSNHKWKDLYLSGNLTDGTNSIAVSEIASKEFVIANVSSNDFTDTDKSNLDANTSARHTHTNKDILDKTTASYTIEEKNKLNSVESNANRVTSTSQILNDSGYITSADVPKTLAELSSDATHRTVTDAEKESWNNKLSQFTETDPTVPTYVKNISEEDITNWNSKVNINDIPTKTSQLTNDSGYITNQVNNLVNYTLATNTGSTIEVSVDSNTFIGTISLKNNSGTVISSGTFDLPLETVVVNGYFDEDTKKIVLVLQNGNEISIDASSLINGLASQSDLTSLTNTVNNKVDKVTGKGLSSNDFTDTDKNNLDANTTSRHTHSNKSILDATTASYTTAEKSKLSGIETGAEVNVQADWNESNTASSAYIKNKPTIPADLSGTVVTLDGTQTITGEKTFENVFNVNILGNNTTKLTADGNTISLFSRENPSRTTNNLEAYNAQYPYTDTYFQLNPGNISFYIDRSGVGIFERVSLTTEGFKYNNSTVATVDDITELSPKLYSTTGTATDGAMTQNAITEELNNIKNSVLDTIYPVGSIYLSMNNTSPASFLGGTWLRYGGGVALWVTSVSTDIGKTLTAGLPNITGEIAGACYEKSTISGAFATSSMSNCTLGTSGGSRVKYNTFDASRSSSIYGNSDTVQPPAICVSMWKRTA